MAFVWLYWWENSSGSTTPQSHQADRDERNAARMRDSKRWRNFAMNIERMDLENGPAREPQTREWPALDCRWYADWIERDISLVQMYGLRGIPPVGSMTVVAPLNGGEPMVGIGTLLSATEHGDAYPDVEEGETALWSVYGQEIRLDSQGQVSISAPSGAQVQIDAEGNITLTPAPGKEVRLAGNGSSPQVVRVGDVVDATASMSAFIAAVTTFCNGITPGAVLPVTGFGVCQDGSTKVRCG